MPTLDAWLINRAAANEASGASRTYVVCSDGRVVAYYALASGAVAHVAASPALRRNMPDPVPVLVLGRLAVDTDFAGRGIARALVRDAFARTILVARSVGVRALVVQAIDEKAAAFYRAMGFRSVSADGLFLMVPVKDLHDA